MKKKKTLLTLSVLLIALSIFPNSVTIQAAPKKIKFNVKKLDLTVGSNYQLRLYNLKKKHKVTFSSSNPAIVSLQDSLSSQKKITATALSTGNSVISATVKKGKKVVKVLKCRIKVSPNAIGIKFMKQRYVISASERIRLETIIKPNTSLEQPVFETDNPNIAKVNSRGIITPITSGTVTVTATLLSCDVSTSCTVVILPEEDHRPERTPRSKRSANKWTNITGN